MLPHAQLLVLAAWTAMALGLVGIGLLAERLAGARAAGADDLVRGAWIGWCVVVLALQVWHLVLPVDARATMACAALGAVGLAAGGLGPWGRLLRGAWRNLPALAGCAALLLWLSNRALGGPRYGDTGAYFVPTVRWYAAYPIVPGLGNLHGHYALNQSYFLYVAVLEVGPFLHRSSHLANGFLVLALAVRIALAAGRVLRLRRAVADVDLFYALVAPGVLPLAIGLFFGSPSPDVAVFALGVVASAELLALATAPPARRTRHLHTLVLFLMTGLTVKLSFAGLAIGALAVGLVLSFRGARPDWPGAWRTSAGVAAIGAAALVPWVARNVVMSGMPLFPSAVVVLPVAWRVQFDMEGWLRNTVYMGGVGAIWGNPRWFATRLVQLGWTQPETLWPILVGVAGAIVGAAGRLVGRRPARLPLAVVLPGLASLAYCVLLSPMPRYAGATVWLVAATGVLVAIGDVAVRPRSGLRVVLGLAIVAGTARLLADTREPLWLPLTDFEPVSPTRVTPLPLESGLVVNVPAGDACWEAPLPCTPFPNPALRLRRDGDLGAGFMVDPALQERYHYEPGAPWTQRPHA